MLHVQSSRKNPVASLDIQYSVFFLWETKKSLQSKLSLPISTYCQLVNKSIKTSRRIVQCERLETRLKKESPRITAKYKTLKGQHRTLFKTKTIDVLIFGVKEVWYCETTTDIATSNFRFQSSPVQSPVQVSSLPGLNSSDNKLSILDQYDHK